MNDGVAIVRFVVVRGNAHLYLMRKLFGHDWGGWANTTFGVLECHPFQVQA